MLLDEAFGALDASLRAQLRTDVREILLRSGTAGLLVTHDQDEALSISDRIALVRAGRVVQTGTPLEVYTAPVDARAARFLGECTLLAGTGDGESVHCALGTLDARGHHGPVRGPVQVMVRPKQVRLSAEQAVPGTEPRGPVATAILESTEYRGHSTVHRLRLTGGGQRITAHALGATGHTVGSTVGVSVEGGVHVVIGPAPTSAGTLEACPPPP